MVDYIRLVVFYQLKYSTCIGYQNISKKLYYCTHRYFTYPPYTDLTAVGWDLAYCYSTHTLYRVHLKLCGIIFTIEKKQTIIKSMHKRMLLPLDP